MIRNKRVTSPPSLAPAPGDSSPASPGLPGPGHVPSSSWHVPAHGRPHKNPAARLSSRLRTWHGCGGGGALLTAAVVMVIATRFAARIVCSRRILLAVLSQHWLLSRWRTQLKVELESGAGVEEISDVHYIRRRLSGPTGARNGDSADRRCD